jgi:23S rRNA (adenine-N6)-dimethyltransferase
VGRPQPGWGWHVLDRRWAERVVESAHVWPGDWVLDIGAGHGAITAPLIGAGARVIAIEAHPGRADYLRERFGASIIVARADGRDLRLPRWPFHVVANPPFAITSSLLRRLLQPGSRLLSAHLILQRETARRWAATDAPGAGRWGRDFHAGLGMRVPRSAFRPRPTVDAQVLRIARRSGR